MAMKKMRRSLIVYLFLTAVIITALSTASLVFSDCQKTPKVQTTSTVAPPPPHQRLAIPFYKGIAEPEADAWRDMLGDIGRLKDDHVNTVAIQPPVLTSLQSGRQRRVALEGDAIAAPKAIADFHQQGLAVLLAPAAGDYLYPQTSAAEALTLTPGNESFRLQLEDDVLKWAVVAEQYQVELFTPLREYNRVLGEQAAAGWAQEMLPRIRQHYSGPLVASVAPHPSGPPAAGEPYAFEQLNFQGYDYLMISAFPEGESFEIEAWRVYVEDLLIRANAVAARDGLKGVIVADFGGWRESMGVVSEPTLGADGQAQMAETLLELALPRSAGVFFYGWTLPGRGAKNVPVEEVLKKFYGM